MKEKMKTVIANLWPLLIIAFLGLFAIVILLISYIFLHILMGSQVEGTAFYGKPVQWWEYAIMLRLIILIIYQKITEKEYMYK